MQYLLNPCGFMRSFIKASKAGESLLPERFNSIMTTFPSCASCCVSRLVKFTSKSMVSLSVNALFTSVSLLKRRMYVV